MEAARGDRDLGVGLSGQRLDVAGRDREPLLLVVEPVGAQERLRLPRRESLAGELGKRGAVAGRLERLLRDHRRRRMLAVAVRGRPGERDEEDLRAEPPDDADGVLEQLLLRPESQRLVERLGEPEVVRAREELPRAVEPPRREQLLRPDEPEPDAQLVADEILSALAAG